MCSFNPLYIGSSCNTLKRLIARLKSVSIPFISGQVVIIMLVKKSDPRLVSIPFISGQVVIIKSSASLMTIDVSIPFISGQVVI